MSCYLLLTFSGVLFFSLYFPTSERHSILIAFPCRTFLSYIILISNFFPLNHQVCDGMPPRKDFKSPKEFGSSNSSSSSSPSAASTDLLTPDEKFTLPMIDNDTQSTMKQVRTNQRITHRPARIVLFGLFCDTIFLREIEMKCIGLGVENDMLSKRVLQGYLKRSKIRHADFRHWT